jgi:hypothetical protein
MRKELSDIVNNIKEHPILSSFIASTGLNLLPITAGLTEGYITASNPSLSLSLEPLSSHFGMNFLPVIMGSISGIAGYGIQKGTSGHNSIRSGIASGIAGAVLGLGISLTSYIFGHGLENIPASILAPSVATGLTGIATSYYLENKARKTKRNDTPTPIRSTVHRTALGAAGFTLGLGASWSLYQISRATGYVVGTVLR